MKRIILGIILSGMLQSCTHEEDSLQSNIPIRLTAAMSKTATARLQTLQEELTFEAKLYRWDYENKEDESWRSQCPQESTLTCNAAPTGQVTFHSPENLYYATSNEEVAYESSFLSIAPQGKLDDTNQSVSWTTEQLNGKQDVMVASLIGVGNINNPRPGKLVFEHKLSQFHFQAIKRSNSEVNALLQFTLKSIKLPQKISLLADNPITYTEVEYLQVRATSEKAQELPVDQKVSIGTPIMIAPGTTAIALEMLLKMSSGENKRLTATAQLKEAAKTGTAYRITLEFSTGDSPQSVAIEAAIDEWIEGEGGNATVE